MLPNLANIDVEDLVKVGLVLLLIWLVLEIIGEILGLFTALLGPLRPLLGLAVAVLVVLWLLDRL
jgi:hypothetical protein